MARLRHDGQDYDHFGDGEAGGFTNEGSGNQSSGITHVDVNDLISAPGPIDPAPRGTIPQYDSYVPPVFEEGLGSGSAGRHGETPRERQNVSQRSAMPSASAPANASPRRPSSPESMAGSVSSPAPSLVPFQPLPQASVGSMATPALRGLYGAAGGLKGGGLGMPLDPMTNEASDPIDTLIKLLSGN